MVFLKYDVECLLFPLFVFICSNEFRMNQQNMQEWIKFWEELVEMEEPLKSESNFWTTQQDLS